MLYSIPSEAESLLGEVSQKLSEVGFLNRTRVKNPYPANPEARV